MTPVGHSMFGATIAIAGRSSSMGPRASATLVLAAALCANIPDFPLPGWGHERYRVSHSVFVGVALILVAAAIHAAIPGCRTRLGGWRVFLICGAAWLSHYLLDSFYNHGKGLALLWPFSDARLALPIPWFSIVGRDTSPFAWHAIKTCGIEFLCYGALLGAVLLVRRRTGGRQLDRRPSDGE
jgi:hypothetical protein